jgi:hypothetical protein
MMSENCKICGNDIHGEKNIKMELKKFLDSFYKTYDTKLTGHPLYMIIVGDEGADIAVSPFIHPPISKKEDTYDIFIEMLREVYLDANKNPEEAFQLEWGK